MPQSSSVDIIVTLDGVDISEWLQSDFEIGSTTLTEENTGFGQTWRKYLPVGVRDINDIPINGFFDTDPDGPDVVIGEVAEGPASVPRTLVVTWQPGRTTTVPVHVVGYTIRGVYNGITKFSAVLKQAGPRIDVRP